MSTRDLITVMTDSVNSTINGYDASTDKLMFNDYGNVAFMTRNTNNFMHGLEGVTGIPALNDRARSGYVTGAVVNGVLITPRHILTSRHDPGVIGDVFYFWDLNNNYHSRTVVGRGDAGAAYSYNYGDYSIMTLDSDLPAEITPLKVFPKDLYRYVDKNNITAAANHFTPATETLLFSTDQEEKSLVHKMSRITFGAEMYEDTTPNTLVPPAYVPNVTYSAPTDANALTWRENMIPGDSGSPFFANIDNELIFMGVAFTTSTFHGITNESTYNDINIIIGLADANATANGTPTNTGYTLTDYDLSGFFTTNNILPVFPPNLPSTATAVAVYEEGFSPLYDITWSFTYEMKDVVEGDEVGFCMFLQDESINLEVGGAGPDMGVTGGTSLSETQPMSGRVLSIGIDNVGAFGAELIYGDGTVRPGAVATEVDTIAVRNEDDTLLSNTIIRNFDIISEGKKHIRARLGDYGRLLQVDVKDDGDVFYRPILTQVISHDNFAQHTFTESARWRPGVTFCKPLTISSTNATIEVTNFHVEGKTAAVEDSVLDFEPVVPFTWQSGDLGEPPQAVPPRESKPRLPFFGMEPSIKCPDASCGDTVTNDTTSEGFFPQSFTYAMSAFIGDVKVDWNVTSNPHRFIFEYEDDNVIDTGYVGSADWDYEGVNRAAFITALDNTYSYAPNVAVDLAPDGYPYVSSTLTSSTSSFYKDTDSSRVTLNVFAPLSSTDWSAKVGCPYYTLSCGVEDQYICGLTQAHETLRRIIFTNI